MNRFDPFRFDCCRRKLKLSELESALEQRCGNQQRTDAEGEQKQKIGLNGYEPAILEQNRFEPVNRVA